MTNVIAFDDIHRAYKRGVEVLSGVSFDVAEAWSSGCNLARRTPQRRYSPIPVSVAVSGYQLPS